MLRTKTFFENCQFSVSYFFLFSKFFYDTGIAENWKVFQISILYYSVQRLLQIKHLSKFQFLTFYAFEHFENVSALFSRFMFTAIDHNSCLATKIRVLLDVMFYQNKWDLHFSELNQNSDRGEFHRNVWEFFKSFCSPYHMGHMWWTNEDLSTPKTCTDDVQRWARTNIYLPI